MVPTCSVRPVSRRTVLAGALAAVGLAVAPLGGLTPRPAAAATGAAPHPTAAVELIRRYQSAVLSVMQRADALGPTGRADALDAPVRATFDFDRMARTAAGPAWRAADPGTRNAMVEAFAAFSVATHADRFSGYGGEAFEVTGTRAGPAGTLLVETRIVRPGGEPAVPITYVVAQGRQGPKVVDVLLEGSISEVALRRSEWSSISQRAGLPGLIAALQERTQRLLGTP